MQPVGRLTLNANPANFFAETEQVAFHPGHLVPGIDLTDDPLLQARLFSYLDTQLTRLGGPNFAQLPINRPHAPVNDMFRDGMHQSAVHAGPAPYRPNSLDGGVPFTAGRSSVPTSRWRSPCRVPRRVRRRPRSTTTSARPGCSTSASARWSVTTSPMPSPSSWASATSRRSSCAHCRCWPTSTGDLTAKVADGLGLPAPAATVAPADVEPSPALSQISRAWPTDGRVIGIIADETSDLAAVTDLQNSIVAAGMQALVIAPHGGTLTSGTADPVIVQRTLLTTRSTEFDAVVVAGSPKAARRCTGSWRRRSGT